MSRRKTKKQADLFASRADIKNVPKRRVRWSAAYRLVPSRYPPINLFERIAPAEDWDALYELEGATNPRLRDQAGAIRLVPVSRRVSGPGSSIVMAPFTHASRDRPTRFSDGSYGVYYCANRFETALREVAFHMERFYRATNDPPLQADYRTYKGGVNKVLHDIRAAKFSFLLDPDPKKYGRSQQFGRALRDAGSNGVVYPSVRHKGGQCVGAFWPDVVLIPKQTGHIQLKWDGVRVSQWFDYQQEVWRVFEGA